MSFSFPGFYAEQKERVEAALERWLPGDEQELPELLREALEYSLLGGGKRLRGVLVLEAGQLGPRGTPQVLETIAAAVEMIHTYSLVHDDLPAMDDDDYRRGKPSAHRRYGEDVAILVGDALLTRAFEILGTLPRGGLEPQRAVEVVRLAGERCGGGGLIGGQVQDLRVDPERTGPERLRRIHRMKTAHLMGLCTQLGGLASGMPPERVEALRTFGETIGLAFQIKDDLLEVTGDFQTVGKDVDSDRTGDKLTFPRLLGVEASRREAQQLVEEAASQLATRFEDPDRLLQLARVITERDR